MNRQGASPRPSRKGDRVNSTIAGREERRLMKSKKKKPKRIGGPHNGAGAQTRDNNRRRGSGQRHLGSPKVPNRRRPAEGGVKAGKVRACLEEGSGVKRMKCGHRTYGDAKEPAISGNVSRSERRKKIASKTSFSYSLDRGGGTFAIKKPHGEEVTREPYNREQQDQ